MSTALSFSQTDPVSIPSKSNDDEEQAYKDMIKQLAAQAPEPYGAIPPLSKRKDKKRKKKKKKGKDKKTPIKRMSHVENWLAVDSKESIPDEEDLVHSSPFRNFLSTDFLVLPLHMPPPSLSATTPDEDIRRSDNDGKDLRPVLFPIKQPPIQVIPIKDSRLIDEDEDEEDEEEGEEEEEEGEEDEEEEDEEDEDDSVEKMLTKKRSIPSFSKSQQPSTSMTKSYAMSTSPPLPSSSSVLSTSASSTSSTEQEPSKNRWLETIAQLRRSLTLSANSQPPQENADAATQPPTSTKTKKSSFIPMPLPPKRNVRKKRRSEATTQPRFNPETNTYTRDTRSNPDHLRMISAELNMMRHRKLSSPLKPRGFLPRRTDAFVRGQQRKLSYLRNEVQ
ncbi:hypothetical protein [Parasitella parasitica]|uniref:Uncharacterized protein n=1 Tax=Parasitella parasitica TaxID=35722 RepID=A0A0B7MXU5_9FUNG|nr:hypothetical protein [Parasitella parasitica]